MRPPRSSGFKSHPSSSTASGWLSILVWRRKVVQVAPRKLRLTQGVTLQAEFEPVSRA
jgi:hypothetical protein